MVAATTRAVSLVAPSGAPVELEVPDAFGDFRWYGSTRFAGPYMSRQFFLAPLGQHRAIPTHVMPGATERVQPMRGYDAVVYEARDRSDSALVLAGPHHEATTWFGGPAPDLMGVSTMLTSFRYDDGPRGAALTPAAPLLVSQPDVALIGHSESATLIVRRSVDVLPSLPEWAGLALPGGELWRAGREMDARAAALTAGGPHSWRYVLAGDSVAMDLVLLGPESGRAPTTMAEDQIVDALGALSGRWT
ncbi:hypothetical protein [Pseudonocardia broussonetiae]|uniref:Uncharacterized protein n=1 Tax=Pseudonocardia broussonetiae TaxID=2736640 RepID=A0A6M6JIR8_9PSEU|nr:hypothetical protein [Pseudonocardia broussonetiae]QJY47346.1 hypothetical protein HOP40_17295 [Pseudonocardia broussonetiae]